MDCINQAGECYAKWGMSTMASNGWAEAARLEAEALACFDQALKREAEFHGDKHVEYWNAARE